MSSSTAAINPFGSASTKKKKKKIGFRPSNRPNKSKSLAKKNAIKTLKKPEVPKASSSQSSETKTTKTTSKPSPAKKVKIGSSQKVVPKKRKQAKSISIGFTTGKPEQAKRRAVVTPQQEEPTERTHEKTSALAVAVVDPEPRLQDQETLAKLREENSEGVKLSTFCTTFKGPKRVQPEDRQRAEPRNDNAEAQKKNKTKAPREEPATAPVVQIIDGEIVLQESSLMVPGQRRTDQVDEEYEDVVEEDATLGIVGAGLNSFTNRKTPQHWTVEETKLFYTALRQLGTDFGSMEAFFENRTRKQLKRKYLSEFSKNPKLIEMALDPKYQTAIDLSVFKVEVDPEAIEAAKNEKPPAYEPTDGEVEDVKKKRKDQNENVWEEVVEDAEEERVQAARRQQQTAIWFEDEQEQPEPEIEFPEHNMEDFFPNENEEDPSMAAPIMDTNPEPEETSVSISLVPKKAKAKSKKPKFRSKMRKKK